jgi:hypothetical protein
MRAELISNPAVASPIDWFKHIHFLAWLGVLSQLMAGCATVDAKSRKAEGVNLSQYRTFDFAEANHPSDTRFFTPANEARVKAAIRTQLEKRGLRLAEPADLQFCVYLKTITRKIDKANPSVDSGSLGSDLRTYYGLKYDNSWGAQNVVDYPEGTLVVQAVDVKTNRKVWEGITTGVLYRDRPEKQVEARIGEAVAGMFKDFPAVKITSK